MPPLSIEEFEVWEQYLRGYVAYPFAVEPALPFSALPRASKPRSIIDDGRYPSFFERFFGRRPEPKAEEPEMAPPQPTATRERELIEFLMRAPEGFEVREDLGGALLEALSRSRYPISFELIGTGSGVEAQWAVASEDSDLLNRTFDAFYPEVRLDLRIDHLLDTYEGAEGTTYVSHVDFGLSGHAFNEFGVTRSLALDPLISVATALESACQENEGACLQLIFEMADEDWGKECRAALEVLEAPTELLSRAGRKFGQSVYAVTMMLSAWSPDPGGAERLIRSIGNALIAATQGEHNSLLVLSNDGYPLRDHTACMIERTSKRAGMVLSASEVFSLVHVPASSVRAPRLARLKELRTKKAPGIVCGPGVRIGTNEHEDDSHEVALSISHRLRHTYLIGASGTGKSTLLLSMIMQDIEDGRGVALLDPHGDLVDEVLARIPDDRFSDVVLVDPSDEDYPVGLNVLGATSNLERTLLSSDLVAIFRRLSTSWGDQMNAVLANAIIAILESPRGGTLLDLRRFLVDPGFRSEFLTTVQDPEIVFYWKREFPLLTGRPQAPILTRLDAFLRTKPVRYMVACMLPTHVQDLRIVGIRGRVAADRLRHVRPRF